MEEYLSVKLSNGETIFYRTINPDSLHEEVIVLVHGNYSSIKWWDQIVQELKDLGRRILVMDQRGFGKSSYNNKCSRFHGWATDMLELFSIFHITKAVMIGWSFGGAISQKTAELAPDIVKKLILTCSVSHEGLPMKNQDGSLCKEATEIVKTPKVAYAIDILQTKNHEAMRGMFNMLLYQKMPNFPEERKKQLALDPFDQRCYPELLEALANSDIDVDKISAKTLLIHGNEDIILPVQTIMSTASKLGKLEIFQGHGHMIPLEDTPRYIARVRDFIMNQ